MFFASSRLVGAATASQTEAFLLARFTLEFHGQVQARRQQESAGEISAQRDPVPGTGGSGDRDHVSAFLLVAPVQHFMRIDNRRPDQMRPVRMTTKYLMTAEGSALIEVGNTRVLCAASIEETVPSFCAAAVAAGLPPSTRCSRALRPLARRAKSLAAIRRGERRRSSASSGARCDQWWT